MLLVFLKNIKKTIFRLVPFLIILAFSITVFSYSLPLRSQWFGKLVQGDHHFLTGSTIKFTKNWVNEKPWNLYFGMFENPKSVEFNSLTERLPYVSYPSGTIVPIYLISVLTNNAPSTSMVMGFNLFNHFLISLTLGLITYLLFRKNKFNQLISILFSFVPICLETFLPGPFYFLQNIYFSDQAVLLPYALTILLEIIYDENNKNFVIKVVQSFFILYGAFIDWFFYFLIAAIYLKRILIGKSEKNYFKKFIYNSYILILGLIPVLFLAWQIFQLKASQILLERFLTRTGISYSQDNLKGFLSTFWWSHFRINYGEIGVFLYWFSLILTILIFLVSLIKNKTFVRNNSLLLYYFGIFLFLPLIQVYIFKNHSIVHDFSTLKFSLTLSIIPFALFPLLVMNLSNQIKEILFNSISLLIIFFTTLIAIFIWLLSTKFFGGSDLIIFQQSFFYSLSIIGPLIILLIINKKTSVYLIFIISLLLSISYIITSFPLIHRHFKDKQEIPIEKIGQSIAKCTNYNDIVFSFELEIPDRPTVLISQSMKRVYLISSLKDIEQKIKNITKPFQIKLFYLSKPNKKIYKFLNNLGQYKCSGFYYTSFSKEQLNNQLLQNRGN